jgi:hypothetical protein
VPPFAKGLAEPYSDVFHNHALAYFLASLLICPRTMSII